MDKIIPVTRSSLPDYGDFCREIKDLWDSRWLTNVGEKHRGFEAALGEYLGVEHVALFANGHLALEALIEAMELKGEIITSPFTFASTTHAILRRGCTPVFCDIRPEDFTMDPDKIEPLITENTCAILPVHVYGNLCCTDELAAIAARHGLRLLYDAAHAFGVEKAGVSAACLGDAAMFSFHATKVFHSIEGGAVCCRDRELYDRLCALRNFGLTGPEEAAYVGFNAKLNEFNCAMGLCNLRRLDGELEKRRLAAERYTQRLGDVPGLRLNPVQPGVKQNFAYFPLLPDGRRYHRDELQARLAAGGIQSRKYFYPLTSALACYKGRPGFDPDRTPIARRISENILTLPLYADLGLDEVDRVCDIILD